MSAPETTKPLKVLIACEYSGIVRNAFLALGHDAWSCDLRPSDDMSNRHITDDVRNILDDGWDCLIVCHPPCTRLCNSGVRWLSTPPPGRTLAEMWDDLESGCDLFSEMWNANIPFIAVENPIMHKHAKSRIRNFEKAAQTFQPWQFGDDENGPDNEKKRTCLWLRDLPALTPTGSLDGSTARDSVHKMAPGPNREKDRSKFFPGVARAMAQQWSDFIAASDYQPVANPAF